MATIYFMKFILILMKFYLLNWSQYLRSLYGLLIPTYLEFWMLGVWLLIVLELNTSILDKRHSSVSGLSHVFDLSVVSALHLLHVTENSYNFSKIILIQQIQFSLIQESLSYLYMLHQCRFWLVKTITYQHFLCVQKFYWMSIS